MHDFGYRKVAITNLTEGKQYILTWKGGLSTGRKTGGVLKQLYAGNKQKYGFGSVGNKRIEVIILMKSFFRGGGRKKGEIVFTK